VGATTSVTLIADLWLSADAWHEALEHYWDLVKDRELEQRLDALDLDRLRRMDASGWYEFLRDEYGRANQCRNITKSLSSFVDATGVEALDRCRKRLLALDPSDIRTALKAASTIPGLGIAGASGLLSLMYPSEFGTADQFVVNALRGVEGLPEAAALARMKPHGKVVRDGVIVVSILRRKAAELSCVLGEVWTPRMISRVLWAAGREPRSLPRVTR
jgi:hypothetical protein